MDRKTVLAIFRKFDKNGDGRITKEEMTKILKEVDSSWNDYKIGKLFDVIDEDDNGKVSFQELIDWAWDDHRQQAQGLESMAKVVSNSSFLQQYASNGQTWFEYLKPVPPAFELNGNLTGAWAECVYTGCVFELTHPGWHELPEYQADGPVGYVIQYLVDCGHDQHVGKLCEHEERCRQELMQEGQAGSRAFLMTKARNGQTWEKYLKACQPQTATVNGEELIVGAWGECMTAAVIFEHENPRWDLLGPYVEDGPAGQVIAFLYDCGHAAFEEKICILEEKTHWAFDNGGGLPVFDATNYQPPQGLVAASEINQQPPAPTGRKKALLVGCNYPGQKAELRGCINDVDRWRSTLIELFQFKPEDIVVLKDDNEPNPSKRSTRDNIVNSVRWLVQGAASGDALFFQFSGHGAQRKSATSGESDGMDETLIPSDYQSRGVIVDHELFDLMVVPLPSGCKLTVILDCCHSGSALDLPFIWNSAGKWDSEKYTWHTAGDAQMFSGCEDSQCSMDAFDKRMGRPGGAMTTSLCDALWDTRGREMTYPQMLAKLHEVLQARKFDQKPKLSSSQQFDPQDKVFSFTEGMIPNMNEHLGQSEAPPAKVQQDSFLADMLHW